MRGLLRDYFDGRLSRRGFLQQLVATGLTASAARSMVEAADLGGLEEGQGSSKTFHSQTGTGGELLLEIHPSPSQTDEIEAKGKFTPSEVPELAYRIANAAGKDVSRIDWELAKRTARERRGVPVNILKSRAEAAASGT